MKSLLHFVFTFVAVIGMSIAVAAQKNDPKPRPPKEKPPVVRPGDKGPPKNPPKGGNKPKKPQASWFAAAERRDENLA